MKKWHVLCVYLLATGLTCSALGILAPAQAEMPKSLKIGTSTVGGAYFIMGSAIGKVLEKSMGIPVTASVTQGAAENVRLLNRSEIDIGMAAGQLLYTAYNGLGGWKKEKQQDLRAIMTLCRNVSICVALKDSGITQITDLRGKRVGMGLSRPTMGPSAGAIMRGHGFSFEGNIWQPKFTEFKEAYGGFERLHTMLGDGLLDATYTIISAGRPLPALSNLMTSRDLIIVEYNEAVIKRLEAELPYLKGVILPAGSIPGLVNEDTLGANVGGGPCLIVSAGMDAELVYKIVRTVNENWDELTEAAGFFKQAQKSPDLRVQDYAIPYHPGAIRYWKEVGLMKTEP